MSKAFSVDSVSFSFGSRQALEDVSFDVPEGCFAALLGPNGAGKSTLFSLMSGLLHCPDGRIAVAGYDMARQPAEALARTGVVFQSPTLDLDLSVLRNLTYFAALHGIANAEARSRAMESLEHFDLADRAHEPARTLSGGQRRRMEIARVLIHRPSVLLLDEPTVGLDLPARRSITRQVHSLTESTGLTVLWATHLVDEVEDNDFLILLHQGRVTAKGKMGDVAAGRPLSDVFMTLTGEAA
ncbi:MAG: ABC transporter ATP-binding protein [Pseudomonadota bacterium]